MDHVLTYDLAFVSSKRRPKTAPEIVFIIDERHLPEVIDRMLHISNRYFGYAKMYLGEDNAGFQLPIPDLCGNKEFGYQKCGYWTEESGKIHFRLQLRPEPWTHSCALTIYVLSIVLGLPFEKGSPSNRKQSVYLMTICEPGGHGHSVSGWLSQDVMAWLKNYAKDKVDTNSFMQVAPMHPEVVYAMRSVWYAISTPERRPYADAASGWVRENGAFSLNCFGDACDLSIYPDSYNGENYVSVEFGCHNLDSADQQLTLLAGLAKICELAREAT